MQRGQTLKLLEPFLTLPGLVAFWPMSVQDGVSAGDVGGLGYKLAINNAPAFARTAQGGPYMDKVAADYLSVADAAWNSITGALFIAGYVQFDAAAAAIEALVGKWLAAGDQRNYALGRNATGALFIQVSSDGTAAAAVTKTSTLTVTTAWTFVAGAFVPSTSMSVWANGTKWTSAAGIGAAIHNGTGDLEVGSYNGGSNGVVGNMGVWGLYRQVPTDAQVAELFSRTRWAYGA